jgi:hypothetical protein
MRASCLPAPNGRTRTGRGRNAHLLLQSPALTRSLDQPIDRFRHIRVANEHALDRAHIAVVGSADEVEIGGVRIEQAAALVGDQYPVAVVIGHSFQQRVPAVAAGQTQNTRRRQEERNDADRGEKREQRKDVEAGVVGWDIDEACGSPDQQDGDEQHEPNRAGARHASGLVESRPGLPLGSRPFLTSHDGPCARSATP